MLGTTLADMDIFSMGTYDGTELGSTDGNADGKFEVFLLGTSLVSLDGLEVGCTEGTELWIYDVRVLGTTLWYILWCRARVVIFLFYCRLEV